MNIKQKFLIFGIIIVVLIILGISLSINQDQIPVQSNREIDSNTFIEISLNGGGFYGGINPTTENERIIKNDGEIIFRYKSLYGDDTEKTYFIPRVELQELAQLIMDSGFFNMKDVYDCSITNQECKHRKKHYPPAVPLEIDVTIGNLNKKVVVTVYEAGMVDYPENLDKIIDKINEIFTEVQK